MQSSNHAFASQDRWVVAATTLLLILAGDILHAQGHVPTFEDLPYYEPLVAEPRAARIQLLVPAWAKELPHSADPGSRFAWQITLGRELPLIAWRTGTTGPDVAEGEFGIGVWLPVSFHMIEDFKDPSAPIVDTDYRFGSMVKARYGLGENAWLGFRLVPWAHESTHLGDEYTIVASARPDFERVNVSFEYYEYGVSYETVFGEREQSLTLRHGGINLWGGDGYYSDHLLGVEEPTLTPSRKNYEPSLGFEWRAGLGDPVAGEGSSREWFVSADARYKLAYQLHQKVGAEETRHWSWAVAVGRAVSRDTPGKPLRDYFLYFYRGVNPYGQLRTQSDFWSAGVGWTFGG